jgi:tRNA A-37 threonylcarbamoyl transferase component Bud32
MLEDPARMRETLQRHLQPPPGRMYEIRDLQIANTRRRDGARGSVQYDLRLEEPATGETWDVMLSGLYFGGGRTRQIWESLQSTALAEESQEGGHGLPAFGYVPELDLLLQRFPHDLRLPALARLMTGPPSDLVPHLLTEFGQGDWQLAGWDARAVQYRADMRAIVWLGVRATTASGGVADERPFYAKIYRDPEEARRAHHAQTLLHSAAISEAAPLLVAKPIAHLDSLNTVVTTAVPGVSLSKIVKRGDVPAPTVRAAARAVAAFHQLDVAAPPRPHAEEVARLRETERLLQSVRPALATEIAALVDAVITGLEGAPTALIHGDLKPDHVLVDGDRVALIDFDLIATADPVIDVAHLLAFLGKTQERGRPSREGSATPADIFVAEYFAHVPASWPARLPLYHALTSIHKAAGLARRRGENAHGQIDRVLGEGQGFLTGEGDAGAIPSFRRRLTRSTHGWAARW